MALSSMTTSYMLKEMALEKGSDECEAEEFDSFLTPRQIKVLQMRLAGFSQQDVADSFGTTRSNISILEKRAHQNIARARRTLEQWMMLQAPISLAAKAGTDVFELPAMIFAAADEKNMRLPITSLDIVVQLRRLAPRLFQKRVLLSDARIFVTEDGELLVDNLGYGCLDEVRPDDLQNREE